MILTPLMKHQAEAIEFLLPHPEAANFMGVGTGKSLTSLALADKIGAKRILITSDKNNVVNTWPEQVGYHTDWDVIVRPESLDGNLNKIFNGTKPLAVVANYEHITARYNIFRDFQFDMWVGDESSQFKDQRTDKHKSLEKIVSRIKHRMILNGTPTTERLEDFFGQYRLLDNGHRLGRTIGNFRSRFMQPNLGTGFGWVPKKSGYTMVQKAVADITYWPSLYPDLKMPTINRTTVTCDMPKHIKQYDDQLRKDYETTVGDTTTEYTHAVDVFQKRLQLMGGVLRYKQGEEQKFKYLKTDKLDMLSNIIKWNTGSKIVVWHNYIEETKVISKHIKANNTCKMFVVDSSDDTDVLEAFRQSTRGVLLIRCSMCRGLNQLADADIAVFYSLPFAYITIAQAEGRSRRLSSKISETNIVYLITKGGIDSYVYDMLVNKRNMSLTAQNIYDIVRHGRIK